MSIANFTEPNEDGERELIPDDSYGEAPLGFILGIWALIDIIIQLT